MLALYICMYVYVYVSVYVYVDVYVYVLWSYYLGHVWGFLIVTNWATFVFLKKLFLKKHYKNRGFSRFFVQKKGGTQNF